SSGAQIAVLAPGGTRRAVLRTDTQPARRPVVLLVAFTALAVYGVSRWATLLSPAPAGRLAALLVVAVVVAAVGTHLYARNRPLAIGGLVVAAISVLAISGIPGSWIVHVRVAVSADAV